MFHEIDLKRALEKQLKEKDVYAAPRCTEPGKEELVMETPEDCESCVLHGGIFHSFCKINCRYIEDLSAKPDWCPLKPLPEKKRIHCSD